MERSQEYALEPNSPEVMNLRRTSCGDCRFFFFQAEDGIRDYKVTGVQTCALPIFAYLVRRLLENGANTSFVNRLADEAAPLEEIIADPVERATAKGAKPVVLLARDRKSVV